MFVSIYYKPSLFNAHTVISIVHIFMNVNKLCLNQVSHNNTFQETASIHDISPCDLGPSADHKLFAYGARVPEQHYPRLRGL